MTPAECERCGEIFDASEAEERETGSGELVDFCAGCAAWFDEENSLTSDRHERFDRTSYTDRERYR